MNFCFQNGGVEIEVATAQMHVFDKETAKVYI